MSLKRKILLTGLGILLFTFLTTLRAQTGDYDQFKLDMLLANRGDSGAQFYVAGAFEEGRGVDKNLNKAFEWYSKAANNKHNGAQYKLGEFYENGWGVTKDTQKARYWYKEAEKNGSRLAKTRIREIDAGKKAEKDRLEQKKAARLKEQQRAKKLAEVKARKAKERKLAEARAKRQNQAKSQKQIKQKAQLAKKKKAELAAIKKSALVKKAKKATPIKVAVPSLISAILKGKWYSKTGAASMLPSSVNNCLKASEKEIVCFSAEQQRVIGNSKLTFTTKSTLTNFNSKGQFKINYYFNVLNIAGAAGNGAKVDPSGLRIVKGWQEPQQVMSCRYLGNKQLSCHKGRHKFSFKT